MHDETYMRPIGNIHWRGVVIKKEVRAGDYDIELWSLRRLKKAFG